MGQQCTKMVDSLRKSTADELQPKITKEVLDKLQPTITNFRIDAISLSQGLIIKFDVEFDYPDILPDITKYCKSSTYTLTSHDIEIFHGKAKPCKPPPPREEGKKMMTTTVVEEDGKKRAMTMEITVEAKDVGEKLGDIYISIAANQVKCKVELNIVFSFPGLGEHSFKGVKFEVSRKVSEVLRRFLPVLEKRTKEGYDLAVLALEFYEGKHIIDAVDDWWRLKLCPQHETIYKGISKTLKGAKGIIYGLEGAKGIIDRLFFHSVNPHTTGP